MRPPQLLILSAALLTACHVNSSSVNAEEDKRVAEDFMTDYFSNQQLKQYSKNERLFAPQFWTVTTPLKLHRMLDKRDQLLGRLQNTKLQNWQTNTISGTDPAANYLLVYQNTYAQGEATETFNLRRVGADSIRILSYNLSSDAFLR